jgi:hypothetical protein
MQNRQKTERTLTMHPKRKLLVLASAECFPNHATIDVVATGGLKMKALSSFTGLTALAIILASGTLAMTPTLAKAVSGDQQATEAWSHSEVNLHAPGGVERYFELMEEQGS